MIFQTHKEAEEYVSKTVLDFAYSVYYGDLLVLIRYRYEQEEKFNYTVVQYFLNGDHFECEVDWNEGQTDVTIVAIMPVDEITDFKYVQDQEAYQDFLQGDS